MRLTEQINLKFTPEDKQAMQQEAELQGLELGQYVRMLLKTHPGRKRSGSNVTTRKLGRGTSSGS